MGHLLRKSVILRVLALKKRERIMAPEGEAARLAKRPTAFMRLRGLPVARFEALL
jgi:hypothetical protein